MIRFYAITSFSDNLNELKKVKRGVYANVEDEIRSEFSDRSIEEIRSNRDMILMSDDAIVIKLRLPDKKHRLAKKDGYRLIYMVSKNKETVVFLDIYPKRGPKQRLSVSDQELADLLSQFAEEVKSGNLSEFR